MFWKWLKLQVVKRVKINWTVIRISREVDNIYRPSYRKSPLRLAYHRGTSWPVLDHASYVQNSTESESPFSGSRTQLLFVGTKCAEFLLSLFFILSVYSSFACHRNCHRSTVPASTRLRLQIDLNLLLPFPMFVSCKQLMTLWCTTKRAALKQHKFSSPRLLFVRPFFFRLLELCSSTTESEKES